MRVPTLDKTRRNHGLEHATVALLLERGVSPPMGGYSLASGFVIWSTASPEIVADTARQALRLMKSGHAHLAVSPFCGTNLVVGALIGGLAALIASGGKRGFWAGVRGAIAAAVASSLLSRPVGRFVQRRFTTLPDVRRVRIVSTRRILKGPVSVVWIRTSESHGGPPEPPPPPEAPRSDDEPAPIRWAAR